MSTRVLRGIGAAMVGLGEDIGRRDAVAAERSFQERRDAVNFARQQSLERLRNEFAVGRQKADWERDDTVRADDREYQEGRDAIARTRSIEDEKRADTRQRSLIDYRAKVERDNRVPSPPKYEHFTAADGRRMVYDPATGEARPVTEAVTVESTRAGVKPNEPATERSTRIERRPLIEAPSKEGTSWQVVPHPTEPGRFVQRSSNGDYKALPDTGPEWKITPGQFGGATAVNQSTGQSKVLLPGADDWVDQPAPGGQPTPAPRAAPGPSAGPGGDAPAPSLPPAAVAELRADPSPQARAEFDQVFGAGAAEQALAGGAGAGARKPLIQGPTKNTDRGLREAYATTPEVRERMLRQAREVVTSGSDEEVLAFWRTNAEPLRVHDPQGLYNAFRNRLQKMSREERAAPAAPAAGSRARDAFIGQAQQRGVPGSLPIDR